MMLEECSTCWQILSWTWEHLLEKEKPKKGGGKKGKKEGKSTLPAWRRQLQAPSATGCHGWGGGRRSDQPCLHKKKKKNKMKKEDRDGDEPAVKLEPTTDEDEEAPRGATRTRIKKKKRKKEEEACLWSDGTNELTLYLQLQGPRNNGQGGEQ
jgi:hypothetical protein